MIWMALATVLVTIMFFCAMEALRRYRSGRPRSTGWRRYIVESTARILGVYNSVIFVDEVTVDVEDDGGSALPLLAEQSSLPTIIEIPPPPFGT